VKLHCVISLGLGLNRVKIIQNIAKWGEISSKRHEIWRARLNMKWTSKSMIKFNSEKLIKSETSSCGFASVGFKGGQNS